MIASETTSSSASDAKGRPFFNAWRVSLVAIFFGGIMLYWSSLVGRAVWDDHGILDGSSIGGGTLSGALLKPFLSYFRPLTSLSYFLDRLAYRQDIFGYHLTSVLLHALTACLVAWLAWLMFENRWGAVAAGLLFAASPVQVSVTGWIGGRTDILSCLFISLYLGFLVAYCRNGRAWRLWALSAAFLLALLAKEQNLVFLPLAPIVLMKVGAYKPKRAWQLSLPCIVASVAFVLAWIFMHPGVHPFGSPSAAERIARLLGTATNYLGALTGLLPSSLFVITIENYRGLASQAIGLATLAGLVLLVAWGWRRGGAWAVACSGLALAYLPVSNLVPVPALIVGPYRVATVAIFASILAGSLVRRPRDSKTAFGAALIAAAVCYFAFLTVKTIPMWDGDLAYFREVSQDDPHSLGANSHEATELLEDHRPKEGLIYTDRAFDWIYPGSDWQDPAVMLRESTPGSPAMQRISYNVGVAKPPLNTLGELIYVRAYLLKDLNRHSEALQILRVAEKLGTRDSDIIATIGDEIIEKNRPEGLRYYERALSLDPTNWRNLRRLGLARLEDKRYRDAEKLFRDGIAAAPGNGMLWNDLANAIEPQGRDREALDALVHARGAFMVDQEALEKRIAKLQAQLRH